MPGRLWQAIQDLVQRCQRDDYLPDLCRELIEAREQWRRDVRTEKRFAFAFGVGLGMGLSLSCVTVYLLLK